MKAFGVVTLLVTLSPMGAYAGLCWPGSVLSSSTTAHSESSTLVTDLTTVSASTLSATASTDSTTSGESSASTTEAVSTSTLSTATSSESGASSTDSTAPATSVMSATTSSESSASATDSTTSGESSSTATDSTTASISILSTTTSDAATTTTSAAPQGIEGPDGCCGYPGYFDGHVLALSGLSDDPDDLTAEECAATCTSDLDCTWYIYHQLKNGNFQCNTYGTTPAFVVDETKSTIYYPRECKTCAESQPPPPHQPSCIADIPCRDEGTLDGTQVQFLGLRSVSATDNCGDVCATVQDCTHASRFYDITYGWRCSLTQMGSDTVFIPGTEFYQRWIAEGCIVSFERCL
ncbi:uncharacterized protein NECHADRAFT_82501 [Fusarium vanettenii 77-13-4]|uniref:Apple domain-containing protein n=1 Tax=Fusarium vanettenii (strain ATCC MYA-4622 / CBS 123669 / FGSC 9596 / NRRL 45880 / 77-13-4) TaxID=660122 RepID=C7YXE5_FUSV7|nr:uncharacterized protein NECHADRAFT_82501 [Fusarium vanettenii 77-13-4]EEU43326.1 predicted protein [Fusarium vanettenii 77-13-4]